MAVWYMIDGDVCKFANQQYGASYQEWTAGTQVAAGKTIQFVGSSFVLPANSKYMFSACANTTIDLSKVNTSQCTNMQGLFMACHNLTTLDCSGFNTGNVTIMSDMFDGCDKLESVNVSSFDTSRVTNFTDMFNGCNKLKSLDLSSFNTSNASYLGTMFCNCTSLTTLNLHNFNTAKCTFMNGMFTNCSSLKWLDIYNFTALRTTTTQQIRIDDMFNGCSNLERILVKSGQDWNIQGVTSTGMFSNCTKLPNWDGTTDMTRANNTTDYGYFGVYGYWMYNYDVWEKNSEGWAMVDLYLKDTDWKKQKVTMR